jgi:tRNA modification GTPase
MSYDQRQTIAAISTAPGAGGIAVVRISGPQAFAIGKTCCSAFAKTNSVPSRKAIFGAWNHPNGEQLDEVVVTAFVGPNSYTGEDVLEISCHGSVYVQGAVLESCIAAGARLANPGEYTQRAFLNGRMDLTQAEGVADLIASESEASHRLALNQMKGGISKAMASFRQNLIDFAALIELENDFGEEDVTFADRSALQNQVADLRTEIARLLASFKTGQAIRDGVAVVLAGRPNAGKSTLLNALLEEDRAIVSDIAGTTRDTINADLFIQGVKFRVTDTAGIREASDEIEALGVERTLAEVARASILMYVFDVVGPQPDDVKADLEKLARPGLEIIAIGNKMDLNPYTKAKFFTGAHLAEDRFIPLSALNQMNVEHLKNRLFEIGVGELPPQGSAVLTQARHTAALSQADDALERVHVGLSSGLSGDLIALDLRQALHYIGEVTGEISTDDLLGAIFSGFCIGK